MGQLNQAGIDLIKFYESCRQEAYLCPGKKWTIGWGHTGPEVKPGMMWSKARCDDVFKEDCDKIVRFMNVELALPESLNDNQFSAMVSFAYNCGNDTLEHVIDNVGIQGFPEKILEYVYAGAKGKKKVLEGLVIRRKKEAKLFKSPIEGDLINAKNRGNFPLSNRRYS